jgi:putative ATPase
MSIKAFTILTYILIPFALFFGVIDFVLLLSALANPSALIFVFIVACLVIYTFVSLKFLRTGLQKEQIMAKSLKDWIKVNAYVSLFLCSLFVVNALSILFSSPATLNKLIDAMIEQQPGFPQSIDNNMIISIIKGFSVFLLVVGSIALFHIRATLRYIKEYVTRKDSVLQKAIQNGKIPSMILWGPPGVGKTTIANIIATQLDVPFFQLSAISSGVKEIREIIEEATSSRGSVLFIDEIHRFNKGQQDALLGAVEKGIITLIGATTENPSFEVNSALLSRSQVFVLKSLEKTDLQRLIDYAIKTDPLFSTAKIDIKETDAIMALSGGDARKLLNLLELSVEALIATANEKKAIQVLTDSFVMEVAQTHIALYDKNGEQHYDIISAFIKSMRGSDPNGAVYWLSRMIAGGEDVSFIARRMLIFASEDIGNANPNALLLANACFDAVNKIGYPESRIILSQCAIYLATSVKSNASYEAINKGMQLVQKTGNLGVPLHLRNAPTKLMKDLNYGKEYQYSHMGENNFLTQEYLPDDIIGTTIYEPQKNSREQEIKKFLQERWKGKYGY